MVLEAKSKSINEQSRQLDPDCKPNYPFIYFTNTSLAETENANKGWKLHLSVAIEDLEKTFELIAPILRENFYRFKVIDIQRYKFLLTENQDSPCPYGTFAVTDYGDSIRYKLKDNLIEEVIDKASLGLPVDKPLTPESLASIQDALLKDAVSKKLIDPRNITGLMVDKHSKRFVKGTQFTIRLSENNDNVPHRDIAPIMEEITHLLISHGIQPGERPVSDAPIKDTPYFSIRNSCFALGESFEESYLNASDVGHLYNPALRSNPYAHLIPEESLGPQNIIAHCTSILDLPKGDFRTVQKKDVLILFSFLHQHLNLNLIESNDEELGLLLDSMVMGNFSHLDSKGLWREGHKTEEICRELQGICIYQSFKMEVSWIDKNISYSNRVVNNNLRYLFELIEQKEATERTDEPDMFFEEYYIKSIHFMNFDAISNYFKMSDKEKLNYLLNSVKAWPSFSQQMRQYGYDDKDSMNKLMRLMNIHGMSSDLRQWFFDQITTIPVENNTVIQGYLVKQYLDVTPSLEKALPLIQMLKQSGLAEIEKEAIEILNELEEAGFIDKQENLRPYIINEHGKAQPVEPPKEDASLLHGKVAFFNNMPASSSSSSVTGYENKDEGKRENTPTKTSK